MGNFFPGFGSIWQLTMEMGKKLKSREHQDSQLGMSGTIDSRHGGNGLEKRAKATNLAAAI
jgi:hypothetical protein